jgi:hypothetical protein
MITAPKGDTVNVPLNPAGKKIADAWDAAKDDAAVDKCKAYGAPNLMRIPSRFRISWADDATLKIESDAGRQTRLLHFEAPKVPPPPSRQGLSIAKWQGKALAERRNRAPAAGLPADQRGTVQRRRYDGGELRRRERAERRGVADHRHDRHRPDVSLPHLRAQHALQEGS